MKLIVGLGNPGPEYAKSRHNIGFLLLDGFAHEQQLVFSDRHRFKSALSEGAFQGERFLLAKPLTYMNVSGEALRLLVDFHNLKHHDVLVIHDDADIDFGKVRLALGGGDSGHQGMRSIYDHGIEDVWRLKVGVANAQRQPGRAIDFVLTTFRPEEFEQLPKLESLVLPKLKSFITGAIEPESLTWQ